MLGGGEAALIQPTCLAQAPGPQETLARPQGLAQSPGLGQEESTPYAPPLVRGFLQPEGRTLADQTRGTAGTVLPLVLATPPSPSEARAASLLLRGCFWAQDLLCCSPKGLSVSVGLCLSVSVLQTHTRETNMIEAKKKKKKEKSRVPRPSHDLGQVTVLPVPWTSGAQREGPSGVHSMFPHSPQGHH